MQHCGANELVLIEPDGARAECEKTNLGHSLAFVRPRRIIADDFAGLADADVVMIYAGIDQLPGQTRLELP